MLDNSRVRLYLKAANVGIFSTAADILSMYLLGSYTNIPVEYQLYLSSFLGLLIGFFGQKLITFKNKLTGKALIKQIVLFLTWEIIFIIIIAKIVIYITEPINDALKHIPIDKIKHSSILSLLFYVDTDEDGKEHVELHTITNIAIKHIFIFILFTFVSLPIYKKIFEIH